MDGDERVITADEVSERIVAAFEVDRRLPRNRTPKAPGGSHPTVYRSEDERREVAELRKLLRMEDDPEPTHSSDAIRDRPSERNLRVDCCGRFNRVKGRHRR
jgi:hypothetical protein